MTDRGPQPPIHPPGAMPVDADAEGAFAANMAIATRHPVRAQRVIVICFLISIMATIALGWLYTTGGQTQLEGLLLLFIFGGLGVGMSAWGKWLMPRGPFVEEREVLTSEESQERFARAFRRGEVAIEGRRSILVKLLIAAGGVMTAILLFPLRSLFAKQPGEVNDFLYTTSWKAGSLLLTDDGKPVHINDLEVGGVVTVFPEHSVDPAIDQTLLLRPSDAPFGPRSKRGWTPMGYIAYSKVCTHAGCPVGQYEAQFQELMCPCHQSTFNVLNAAEVVFGPAPRPLPQLPLTMDADGFLRAAGTYGVPIGPGFWSRGGRQ